MVVLAASIVSKSGTPLLSRQFRPIPLSRLSALLTSFPTLLPNGSAGGSGGDSIQNTVLTPPHEPNIRFVYLPLEEVYLVLISNNQSNILLDLDTLGLFSKVVGEVIGGGQHAISSSNPYNPYGTVAPVGGSAGGAKITTLEIGRNAFELLSAMDEMVSLGYREKVDLTGVRLAMEMESHEERIQDIIARNKEAEAKEELKRRAKQLELQRREMQRRGQAPNPYSSMPSSSSLVPPTPVSNYDAGRRVPSPSSGYDSVGGSVGGTGNFSTGKPFKTKGMQLGSSTSTKGIGVGGRKQALLDALGGNEESTGLLEPSNAGEVEVPTPIASPAPPTSQPAGGVENPFGAVEQKDVHLVLREKLSLSLSRDGGLTSFDLKGEITLHINNPSQSKLTLLLTQDSEFFKEGELQFRTHPNVDKGLWNREKRIGLKDGRKSFPVGVGLGVLKWRLVGKDETWVPLSINCWPTPSTTSNKTDLNIEYELENTSLTLHNVIISIPLPHNPNSNQYPNPSITENSTGDYIFNPDTHSLDWSIPVIGAGEGTESGSLEFSCENDEDVGAFFPVAVDFVSQKSVCGVEVSSVTSADNNLDVEFSVDSLLNVGDGPEEGYFVV